MTGNALERGATGTLILIFPLAFALVVLYTAWPVLLAFIILGIVWRIWQHYQWKRWSAQVNPYFHRLIKDNQGRLTATDLAMKANLTGSAAQRFLEKKAEEYGAQRKTYEDQGTVYYFLTASALGSIFADSEPVAELTDQTEEGEPPLEAEATAVPEAVAQPSADQLEKDEEETGATPAPETVTEPSADQLEKDKEETGETAAKPASHVEEEPVSEDTLIQAELAKRLDVHSSTVGKRKSDPDFAEWSQSRDPDGIAWEYDDEEKVFIPLEE